MLNIDPPEHTALRAIVSRGFTPRTVEKLRGALAERAERIVLAALAGRDSRAGSNDASRADAGCTSRAGAGAGQTGEFVTDIACELPLQAIAELLGIPQEDRLKIFQWSNEMIGYDDPDYGGADPLEAAGGLLAYAMTLAEQRQQAPRDDIVTRLVNAEIHGSHLSPDEFGFFVLLLAVAGNETTRNAISHGMLAFLDHPDQWELFKAKRPRTAVEEVIRWATPVNVFQRTARVDTMLGGQAVAAGDRVCLFYGSANFDEEVFDRPEQFDITRSPNPHLGFGGSGAHYCLGANLARLEIELIFNAIADHMPNIRRTGPAARLRSGWLNGIKELPVRYR
jgi:cholest-4-en-3-one 26-monooxygenase